MADAADSKSAVREGVSVRSRPSAPGKTYAIRDRAPSSALGPLQIPLQIGDPVEAALVAALNVATAAVDLDAIKLLAVEIRERRLVRAGVVDLAARRERQP